MKYWGIIIIIDFTQISMNHFWHYYLVELLLDEEAELIEALSALESRDDDVKAEVDPPSTWVLTLPLKLLRFLEMLYIFGNKRQNDDKTENVKVAFQFAVSKFKS